MDIAYNKVDQTALPIDTTRVSASEYNQIAGSLMNIITSAGLTPDSQDNAQLLNALGPRIVETYVNGTSWYRVWSDGWCEQGGRFAGPVNNSSSFTVSFLKDMADTSYTVSFCGTTASTVLTATARYKNSLQFFYSNNANNVSGSDFSWEIKGYTDISSYKAEPL